MIENVYRLIEISDGCMGGYSAVYLTDAPDDSIETSISLYILDNMENPIEFLQQDYVMKIVIDSLEESNYQDMKSALNVAKTFEVY